MRDMREPNRIAEYMSRPWSSVPSGYVTWPPSNHAGGRRASIRFRVAGSNGVWGAMIGAAAAPKTSTSRTASASMTEGEDRRLYPRSLSQTWPRRDRQLELPEAVVSVISFRSQSWIDDVVEEVDDQVDEHEHQADQGQIGSHHGEIRKVDGVNDEHAKPRPLKHGLHYNRERNKGADLHPCDGNHGNERISQRVMAVDRIAGQAAGAGEPDVVRP